MNLLKNIAILCSSSSLSGFSTESDLTEYAHCGKEHLAIQEVPELSDVSGGEYKNVTSRV